MVEESKENPLNRPKPAALSHAQYLMSPMGKLEKNLSESIVNILEAKVNALATGDGFHLELLDDAEKAIKKVVRSLWERQGH